MLAFVEGETEPEAELCLDEADPSNTRKFSILDVKGDTVPNYSDKSDLHTKITHGYIGAYEEYLVGHESYVFDWVCIYIISFYSILFYFANNDSANNQK